MDPVLKRAKRPAKSLGAVALDAKSQTKKDQPEQTQTFRTPEEVAAEQSLESTSRLPGTRTDGAGILRGWGQKLHLSWPPGNKEWIATIIIVLVGGFGVFLVLTHHGSKPIAKAQPELSKPKEAKSTTVPSTLTGLPVDPQINGLPVTAVMIENSLDARPQSGLGQAGVVFEAIAEGGITRFLALFQDSAPNNIGPIRSARPYYIQWAMGFDASYAHVGGSPEALNDIKAWGVKDLDQFANSGSYHRISSRAAPHNVYTSIEALNQLENAKGYNTSTFAGFARIKSKPKPAKVPTAKSIDISISGPLYNVHYDYNAATNSYNRVEGGAPHVDANTNTQISPTVVITMAMPYGLAADDHHSQYGTIGSGQAYIFQNGTVTTGTWTKTNEKSQITFTDAAGKPLLLNPGQTWLTAVDSQSKVASSP